MQYTTKFKRLVSCLLVFVMLLGMIPFSLTTASAASTGPFELPVEGSTGYAVRDINIRATPSESGTLVKNIPAGTAYRIIGGEEGNYLKVQLQDGTEGYASITYTMINLPDVIPSITYNATNSYNSLYKSLGYDLPGITGQSLYTGKTQNDRLGYSEFMMPCLYEMAKKIAAAQQSALANNECLILYEAFRPREVQAAVGDALNSLADSNAEVDAAVRKNPNFSMAYFINTGTGNHQLGVAIDVSLGSFTSTTPVKVGDTTVQKPTNVQEYSMPTQMHELSQRAAVFTKQYSHTGTDWQSQTLADSFKNNQYAVKLQSYCTGAGLTPLCSEWWHFNDNTIRPSVVGSATGAFYISQCLSTAPDGSTTDPGTNPDPDPGGGENPGGGGENPGGRSGSVEITGSIKIQKVDMDDPTTGLAGAVIEIRGIDVAFGPTRVVTGADGYVPENELDYKSMPIGSYVAVEVGSPEGHLMNPDSKQAFYWDGKSNIQLVFQNDSKVSVQLQKVGENDAPLADAIFDVYKDGQLIGSQATDAAGTITIDNISEGFYSFTEKEAPEGYAKLTDSIGVYVDEADIQGNETIVATAKNFKSPTLTIKKLDASSKTGVSGAVFEVRGVDVSYQNTVTTGGDGTYSLTGLEPGTYEVTELSVPAPYILDTNNRQSIVLDPGASRELTFENSTEPGLRIIKKDKLTGAPVPGVTFLIEKIDGSYSEEATTDDNGEIFIEHLEAGSYKVTEIRVPGNYILNDVPQTVTLEPNKTSTLEFFNQQRPGLLIQKVDKEGNGIEGVKFNVKVKDGSDIGTFTTDENGEIFIPDLDAGWYTVTETFVPGRYILDPTPHDVLLEEGASGDGKAYYTLRLENKRTPELTIYKKDSIVGGPVEGAKFQIWYAGDGEAAGSLEDLGIYYSDENGQINLGKTDTDRLKPGWYQVTELEAPDGYQIKDPATQSIYLAGDDVKSLTFENTPLSAIIVLKKDSVNGNPVPGCTFQLRYLGGTSGTGGTVIGQKTTGTNGSVIWTQLEAGTYIVEEIEAADGYNIVTAAQTVYISGKDQDVITVEFDNAPDGNLLIKKVCSVNPGTTLAGAEFKVTYADGTLIGESNGIYTTDANGEILISGLEPGKSVVVTETKAPAGFIIDTQPQTIVIQAGKTVSLTFANQPKGELIIEKRDSVTGETLSGAQFRLTTAAGCEVGLDGVIGDSTLTQNGIFTTDANGQIHITNLQPGAYVITEIKAPDGYVIDSPMTNVVIGTNGDTQTVIIEDTPKGALIIEKRDSVTHEPLADATFRVTTSDGTVVDNAGGAVSSNGLYTTNASGQIVITDLKPDTYIVTEVEAPEGYQMDAPSQTVKMNSGDTQTLTFYDTPKGTLVIEKRDSITRNPLQGAIFEVTTSDGAAVIGSNDSISSNGRYTTDAEGQIVITGLKEDTYIVTEIQAPLGYEMDAPSQTVKLLNGDTQTLTFYDTPKGTIVIEKRDSVTKEPLQGAIFEVTDSSGSAVISDNGTISSNGKYETDSNGQIIISGLDADTYVVTEIKAPAGYEMDAPSQTVRLTMGDTQTLTFYDTPQNTLNIVKKDSSTGKNLAGATFYITNSYGEVADTASGLVGSNGYYTTDETGMITLTGLETGTYVVRETKAPDGYILDEAPQTIAVDGGGTYTLTFYNDPEGSLIIEKRDKLTNEPLYGATFRVTTSDGSFVAQGGGTTSSNGLYTTDRNGQIVIYGLQPGTYVVTEETAPDGYLLDAPSQTVEVNANDTQTLTFYDTPIGGLIITKIDEDTGERLEGAQFEIRKMNGEIVGTYYTDRNGNIQLTELDSGWYEVVELKAPDGYLLDSTPQQVEVKDGETTTLELTNTASGSMLIHKIDSVTKEGIQGVKFMVYDSSMTPIGEFESDDQGYVHLNKTLEDGKYYVREIVAADGYILDNEVKSFWVESGDTTMIEWENTAEYAQIQVVKTSADYNSTNGLPAGTPLAGAVFTIYDKRNNVVDTIQTNASGIASSKLLPLGIYTVKETTAPTNYGLNTNTFTADLEFAGQVVQIQVTDPSITTGVTIKKTGYQQVMNNSLIRYTVSNVANTSSVSLNSFYWRDTIPTDAMRLTRLVTGTYSATQNYKVTYTTNLNSNWQTAYDNLSTAQNYTLDMSASALGLASNEYVTSFMLVFGIVPSGFHQLTDATVDGTTLYALTNGYQFTNKADVGGLYGQYWQQSIARWTTSVYSNYKPYTPTLPRTGY